MKLAVKALTQSDLSFFKVHLRYSKQKAINLNSDIFVEKFYPNLQGALRNIKISLNVVGPGGRGPHRLTRKVLYTAGGKNWRLNGEFIHDPDGETARYDRLVEGDLAVFRFDGIDEPDSAVMVLVSSQEDSALFASLSACVSFSGRRTMEAISEAELAEVKALTKAAYPGIHPVEALLAVDSVEDVLFTEGATPTTAPTGRGVPTTPEELRQQLLAAQETGDLGEALFAAWLVQAGHAESDFDWVSRTHARASYDFIVLTPMWLGDGEPVMVDVKSTRGPFDRDIHMSIAEVRFAATRPRYRIARIYGVGTPSPELVILRNVQIVAADIIMSLSKLPSSVEPDSFRLSTRILGPEFHGSLVTAGHDI